ncbi:MAG: Oar protein [Lysobacteraceae bacterium SCN 69-48]|nr:MAG: Oar protein [Xanthomonadaceae bacterium SCN 69-48]
MKHPNRARLSKLSLGLMVALAAAPVFAQSTSAGVGGQIVSAGGQPVAGAEVTITHVESGTVSRATTDASGRYNARGLRVGGPYTITVTKAGEGTKTEENVYLNLNQVNTVNAQLDNNVTTLGSVVAVGVAGSDVFSANRMGTSTNVTRDLIEALPSANRNMQDFIRLDPRISQVSKADGAISAGGQNTRYNAIRIDGIGAGDPFGLESNNFPTERQPVSMDAIQEINIDLANYDTTIFGGTGAVINAVTRSGTNEFKGTLYATYRDKDMVRARLPGDRADFSGFNDETTYGATFGGPIVKDKLFFFANYEKYTRSAPGLSLADTAIGRGTITDQDIQNVISAAKANGVADPGSLTVAGDSKTEIEEYAVKVDWNINDSHRAALRYNKMEQSVLRFPGMGTSTVSLSSYWYAQPKAYETWMAEVFSDWSENLSTEFKASYKDYSAMRAPFSSLPSIQIQGFGTNNSSVYLGTEINTHVNIVESKELSLFAAANWYAGDHTIKFGADYQDNDLMNFYGRNLNGSYAFRSLQDFVNKKPNSYSVRAPRPNGGSYADVPAVFTLRNLGLFLQDSWAVNDNLSLLFGVRMDVPDFSDQKLYNPLIEQTYGYDNTYVPDSKLIQPRFGFNYTFDSERPMQLRGGVGLFGGAAPNVWLAGAYGNTGLNYVEYTCNGALAPVFSADPAPNIPANCSAGNARANVDIIEPGLKLPSVWKSNLAFDMELPWHGIVASAEALFTKVNDGLYVERLDVYSNANRDGATAYGPDGRPLFWNAAGLDPTKAGRFGIDPGTNGAAAKANRPAGIGDVMLVRNTDKGSSTQLTFGLDKPLTQDWGWSLFYTYTAAEEVSPLTSSQNTSNWGGTLIGTVNEDVAYNSRYAIKDRFAGQLHWQHAFFGDYKTKVSMFYEGRSGRPFSYIFYNDANGDGDPGRTNQAGYFNDLFYVPSGPGDVLWTGGAAMEQSFFNWLAEHPELNAYRGQIAPANAFRTKWVNNFDVRISQELPGFFAGHKTELSLDIMNIGNLLNKNWGLIEDYGFNATSRVANYAGIDPATGKYVYNFTGTATDPAIQENNNDKGNTGVSRWSVMVGFKYRF